MWIRSQNRTRLIRTEDFEVIGKTIFAGIVNIGEYATEKKALEVFNELEYAISDGIEVFEMPKK